MIKTIADIAEAKTADLVAFWNSHNERQIAKFADRKTAEARCAKLLESLTAEANDDPAPKIDENGEDLKAATSAAEAAAKAAQAAAESAQAAAKTVDTVVKHHEAEKAKKAGDIGAAWLQQAHAAATTGKKAEAEKPKAAAASRSTGAGNSAGVAASWDDPSVRAARATRDAVMVTVDGATTTHKSTRDAFRHYRLPDSKHIRFRMALKASRHEAFEFSGKVYDFRMAVVEA